jgi:SWI/SNF-related matrix-associated actin-dependent regulator of chromatin subfamily A3
VEHGQNRKGIEELQHCDVVITTFQTLSAAWKKQRLQDVQDPIFSVIWHRVILDEGKNHAIFQIQADHIAHTIQNAQSQLAQACCALQAERRWAITGTPIQNKLTDFASIVKFLRVYPYCDQKIFDEEISRPWHLADREGFLTLKSLVRAITISRTKSVINLPARVDEIHHLEFSPEERAGYNAANKETVALFEEAISSGRQSGKTFNALARLNFLRLFCNLGLVLHKRPAQLPPSTFRERGGSFSQTPERDLFYSNILDGSATCAQCGQALLDDLLERVSSPSFDKSSVATPTASLCDNCKSEPRSRSLDFMACFQKEYSASAPSSSPTPCVQTQTFQPLEQIPTKIKALVVDVSKHCPTRKW